jgi:hypothetical protein
MFMKRLAALLPAVALLAMLAPVTFSTEGFDELEEAGVTVVAPFVYDEVHNFNEGLAAVARGDWSTRKYGFINTSGNLAVPMIYDAVNAFREGFAAVRQGDWQTGKWGFVDKAGGIVIPLEYDEVGDFSEGLAAVRNGDKTGYIDRTGRIVIPLIYDCYHRDYHGGGYILEPFSGGLARVRTRDGWYYKTGYINQSGTVVVPLEYRYLNDFDAETGLALAINDDWMHGFIDRTGRVAIPIMYDGARMFSGGLAAVRRGDWSTGRWGFIDASGREAIPMEYDSVSSFDAMAGLAAVAIGNKYGFIDRTGNVAVPLIYDCLYSDYDGSYILGGFIGSRAEARITYGRGYDEYNVGLIDRNGATVLPVEYSYIGGYDGETGLALFRSGDWSTGKWGYTDQNGRIVASPAYDYAYSFSEGAAAVRIGDWSTGRWGYIDQNGNEVVAHLFEDAYPFREGLAAVRYYGKWGFISLQAPKPPDAASGTQVDLPISYAGTQDFTGVGDFLDYIRSLLSGVRADETISANSMLDLVQFMEYAIESEAQTGLNVRDNIVPVASVNFAGVFQRLNDARTQIHDLITEFKLKLPRTIRAAIRVNVSGLDFDAPYVVGLDRSMLNRLGDADGIYLTLDGGRHYIYFGLDDVRALLGVYETLYIQMVASADKTQYSIIFADQDHLPVSRLPFPVTFAFPAASELSTVILSYADGTENWGGQYNPNTRSIEIATPITGVYDIMENVPVINDISHLTEAERRIVEFMVAKGFFTLDRENRFYPESLLNRYQFNTVLVKMFFALDHTLRTTFTDVPKDSIYYAFVASSQANNIIAGISETEFGGDLPITRETAYVLCGKTLAEKKGYIYPDLDDPLEKLFFTDAALISDWAKPGVSVCILGGMIENTGYLHPQETISRKEGAEILYELFMLLYETPALVNLVTAPDTPLEEEGETPDRDPFPLIPVVIGGAAIVLILAGMAVALLLYRKMKKHDGNV